MITVMQTLFWVVFILLVIGFALYMEKERRETVGGIVSTGEIVFMILWSLLITSPLAMVVIFTFFYMGAEMLRFLF